VSAPQRRQAVCFLKDRRLSERRSCGLAGIGRSSYRYQAQPRDDSQLVERLKAIASQYRRYGYRRAWWVLHCEGRRVNPKRVYRVWRQTGLCLPRRRRRKPRHRQGVLPCVATHPGHVWTYDFIADACTNGRQLKILTVTDEFTRESLTIEPAHRLPSSRVLEVLQRRRLNWQPMGPAPLRMATRRGARVALLRCPVFRAGRQEFTTSPPKRTEALVRSIL